MVALEQNAELILAGVESDEESKMLSYQRHSQKELKKGSSHPMSHMVLLDQNQSVGKIVTSQPEFHDPILPKVLKSHSTLSYCNHAVLKGNSDSIGFEVDEAQERRLQKMTRHEENLQILKKFLKVSQEKKGGNEGVFLATSFPSKTEVSLVEERVKKMATALARVSLREWMLTGFSYIGGLEEISTRSDFHEAFKNSFKSFAKLILRIFDMDDFERSNCSDEITKESREFSNKFLFPLPLKSDEDPYELVAKGKMNFDEFPSLREQDVGKLLEMYMNTTRGAANVFVEIPVLGSRNFELTEHIFEEGHHGRFVELARAVLLEHVPEESIRIHSILDFLVCPCGHAVDEFVQEAIFDAVWNPKLEKLLTNDQLNCLADAIAFCLVRLVIAKRKILMDLSCNAIWVLIESGSSPRFAEGVYDLVKVADGLRRFQNHRFISKHHILWAIRLTELKVLVDILVESVGLRNVVEEPAKCPSYIVYMSAQAAAHYHGHDVVEVEHLVVATVYEMTRPRQKNPYEFNERRHRHNLLRLWLFKFLKIEKNPLHFCQARSLADIFTVNDQEIMPYSIVYKDGKSYMHENGSDYPVRLKEYETPEQAHEIYMKLQSCRNCHVTYLYPPFQVTGKTCGYLAALEGGISLQSFLTPENVETLFDINALTQRPYQASWHYKNIVRGLVIAGKRLIKEGLICSFNLDAVFLLNNLYVEVTDFYSGEGSQLWRGLHELLSDINSRHAHYVVDNDFEMTEVLNLLQILSNPGLVESNRYVDKLLKSTFFWTWRMKRNLIGTMGQLFELEHFKPLCVGICRYSFPTNWIERVRSDRELDKLFVLFRKVTEKEFDVGSFIEPQFHPIDFIRCTSSNYYVMRSKIEKDTCEKVNILLHAFLFDCFKFFNICSTIVLFSYIKSHFIYSLELKIGWLCTKDWSGALDTLLIYCFAN
ncbi:hypothetical protein PTKIN_Ptkin01aG0325600 [Pterospermum kingtungense]